MWNVWLPKFDWIKRAAVGCALLCFAATGLCAFDLQYGDFFRVSGITLEGDRPVMPVTRGQYVNARVLDAATFEFLKTCPSECRQDGVGEVHLSSIRQALTRPGMWIAGVAVDQKWLLTFLVFENEHGIGVVVPEPITVLSNDWSLRVERLLEAGVQEAKQGK